MAWKLPEHHRATADRIPAAIRAELQPHELLARCELAAELTAKGFAAGNARTLMYGYLDQANLVLKAMTPRQLAGDLGVLEKGLAVAPPDLVGGYAGARAQLERDNPQPSAEHLARAEATVARYGPTTKHFSNPASPGRVADGHAVQVAPGRWIRNEDGEALLTKALPHRSGR